MKNHGPICAPQIPDDYVIGHVVDSLFTNVEILLCEAGNIITNYCFHLSVSFNRVKLVRLGHPARLLPQVLDSALDAQVFEIFNSYNLLIVDLFFGISECHSILMTYMRVH